MTITIRAIGSLKQHIDSPMTITEAATVGAALDLLDLPRDVSVVMMVNDKLAHTHTALHDGDVLQLVPVISGG
ncbi:MAG: MoaD/ThiS family protein [Caldilineales bacterium]|nr:MoaD/ThiS family protein [Caldilineales bacterium]